MKTEKTPKDGFEAIQKDKVSRNAMEAAFLLSRAHSDCRGFEEERNHCLQEIYQLMVGHFSTCPQHRELWDKLKKHLPEGAA